MLVVLNIITIKTTIRITISIDRKENTAKTYKNNIINIMIMIIMESIIRTEETDMAMRRIMNKIMKRRFMTIIIETIITNHHIMPVPKILTITIIGV